MEVRGHKHTRMHILSPDIGMPWQRQYVKFRFAPGKKNTVLVSRCKKELYFIRASMFSSCVAVMWRKSRTLSLLSANIYFCFNRSQLPLQLSQATLLICSRHIVRLHEEWILVDTVRTWGPRSPCWGEEHSERTTRESDLTHTHICHGPGSIYRPSLQIYRKISNTRCTKPQNLNDSPLVLQSSLPNPSKPGVKLRTKT